MNMFKNMRLTTMIYLLVSILLAGLILSGIFSYVAVERFREASDVNKKVLTGKNFEGDLVNPAFGLWAPIRLAAFVDINTGASERQEYNAEYNAFKRRYKERLEWARANLSSVDVKNFLGGEFNSNMEAFFNIWDTQFWPAVQANNKEEVTRLVTGPMMTLFKENTALNKRLVEKQENVQAERIKAMEEGDAGAGTAGQVSFWISVLSVLLGLLISIAVAMSINARLRDIVSNVANVSNEISSQIDAQGASVSQLSTSVHETTTSMDQLNASFQHTESLAGESSSRAKNALKHSDEGNALTTEMLEGLTLHKEKVAAIVDQIARLSEITHQIHNVAAATSNLTNQTNILALNAAVQSAHVKQQTEGFSVIASEIRKLADESKKFLSHIDVLAENIKHATDATMTLAEDGQKTLQECIKLAQSVSKSFSSIMTINNGSFEGAEQVVLNVKQQVHAVHQVLGAMEIVNNVSQETMHGMEQVRGELQRLNMASENLKALV